jgi:murein DD-endopeptidase MepM/ murein hydrolase activator NlpD
VAIGAATNLPDAKAVDPAILANLESASADTSAALDDRSAADGRATRDDDRGTDASTLAERVDPKDAWALPLENYTFTSAYGVRWNNLHGGIDLAAPEGTTYKAVHGGVVTSAGHNGAYGFAITIEHADGTETVYAHSRRLYVQPGQTVKAGDVIGEVGNTGHSYGPHLHLELHVDGKPTDPVPYLRRHGVDIQLELQSVYGDLAAS